MGARFFFHPLWFFIGLTAEKSNKICIKIIQNKFQFKFYVSLMKINC